MGTFRTLQNNLLTSTEKELVDYNVYDKDGVYKRTEEKDVLLISPNQLTPLDKSMTVEYLRPINKVELGTKLKKRNISNNNPHFYYGSERWTLISGVNSYIVTDADLAADSNFTKPVKSLTASKCLKNTDADSLSDNPSGATIRDFTRTFIETVPLNTQVSFSFDVEVGFSYYVSNNQNYDYRLFLYLAYEDDSGNYYPYDFVDNKFSDTAVTDFNVEAKHFKTIRNSKVNQWQNFAVKLNSGSVESRENIKIRALIKGTTYLTEIPANGGETNHNATLIDNFFVGNYLDFEDDIVSTRERSSGSYSGIYEQKGRIFSQELDDSRFDMGIIGAFKSRLRTSTDVSRMEELLSQEILNDHREYVKRYEGTFYNGNSDPIPVALHNKIWFKFNDLEEDVTAYIDSMDYNVKRNEYTLVTHIPNQDDDISSTYQVTFE